MPDPRILVSEVGLRDGLQSLRSIMPTDAKMTWIRAEAAAGVREIEVGSFVPAELLPQLADTDALHLEAFNLVFGPRGHIFDHARFARELQGFSNASIGERFLPDQTPDNHVEMRFDADGRGTLMTMRMTLPNAQTRTGMLATGMEHGMEASYVRLEKLL